MRGKKDNNRNLWIMFAQKSRISCFAQLAVLLEHLTQSNLQSKRKKQEDSHLDNTWRQSSPPTTVTIIQIPKEERSGNYNSLLA